jgi:uracil-DNA glycosylase family protein
VIQVGTKIAASARLTTEPKMPRPALPDPPLRRARARPSPPAPRELGSLAAVREAARHCRACPLWKPATQTVFGEGPARAKVLMLGEQPGDQEDLVGRPFVGPAGRMLDRALEELGIPREKVYLTNTVKHFKFVPRGKTRLHARANAAEQAACRQWLQAELELLKPKWIVCLGAMAAQAILGRQFRLMQERGAWRVLSPGVQALATVHPSFLLRQRDAEERARAYREFVADLAAVADVLAA